MLNLSFDDAISGRVRSIAVKIAISPCSKIKKVDLISEWHLLNKKYVWNTNRINTKKLSSLQRKLMTKNDTSKTANMKWDGSV
jgi:hypothetical protein